MFSYNVDYNEFVGELYAYLMADDEAKLRSFGFRCSLYQWLKVLTLRYFIKKRNRMIEDKSHETLYIQNTSSDEDSTEALDDLGRLLQLMPNPRYALVIRRLILDDEEPEHLASELDITTANLYNIKRRAMAQLTRVALKDTKNYGKR